MKVKFRSYEDLSNDPEFISIFDKHSNEMIVRPIDGVKTCMYKPDLDKEYIVIRRHPMYLEVDTPSCVKGIISGVFPYDARFAESFSD